MGNAPSLRDVVLEQLGKLCGRLSGDGVSPGSEGHQLVSLLVKYQIAVHHGTDSNGADSCDLCAILFLYVLLERRIAALKALPYLVKRIGPDAVLQLVFPVIAAGCDGLVGLVNKYRLDPGGAKLDSQGCSSVFDCFFQIAHLVKPPIRVP